MLFINTVTPETYRLLKQIQALQEFAEMQLVGGTALALQLGHRISVDLNFFGKWDYEIDLQTILSPCGDVEKVSATPSGKMAFFYIDGVKVDFVSYELYPWLSPPIEHEGVRLASIKDIAAMKINAITNRGTRKDFVDLVQLLKVHSLREMIAWYQEKYPKANPTLAIRSLSYFVDAETMPLPKMLIPFDWEQAKATICDAVREFTLQHKSI